MPLSEDAQRYVDAVRSYGLRPVYEQPPADTRAQLAAARSRTPPGPEMASRRDVELENADGSHFAVRVLAPLDVSLGVVVYYHGGGWVLGTIDEAEPAGREIAARTGYSVVVVGYRLAPEHPYPAALHDALTAVDWVADHREACSTGPDTPLVVVGDSAGGGLATIVARHARDRGGPAIHQQVLVYPVTDYDLGTPSAHDQQNQQLLDRKAMLWFWDNYVPAAERRAEPDVSPLRADNLGGLPSALVLIAEYDVLVDQINAYVNRLRADGTDVVVATHSGELHGFFASPGTAAQRRALDEVAAFICPPDRAESAPKGTRG